MARSCWIWWSTFSMGLVLLAMPTLVSAESAVLVTALATNAAPDAREAGRIVSDAVVVAASRVGSWDVTASPLDALTLARTHGCRGSELECLPALANRMQVDRIVFGGLRPDPMNDERFYVSLRLFDTWSGRVRDEWTGALGRDDALARRHEDTGVLAGELVGALAGVPEQGTLLVEARPGTAVYVDGILVGHAGAAGRFELRDVHAGRHALRLVRRDRGEYEQPIFVEPWTTTSVQCDLLRDEAASLEGVSTPARRDTDTPLVPDTVALEAAREAGPEPRLGQSEAPSSAGAVRIAMPAIRTGSGFTIQPGVAASGVRVSAKLRF